VRTERKQIILLFSRRQKEYLGDYRLVNHTSIPKKVMGKILL